MGARRMRGASSIFRLALLSISLNAALCAAESPVVQMKLDGALNSITLGAQDVGTEEVILYGTSNGRESATGTVTIQAPDGAVARVEMLPIRGGATLNATSPLGWISVPVRISGGKERENIRFQTTLNGTTMNAMPALCAGFSATFWEQLREYYALGCPADPQPATNSRLCEWVLSEGVCDVEPNPTPSPTPDPNEPPGPDPTGGQYVAGTFTLLKDACDRRTKRYLVRVRVDLRGVAPTLFEQGLSISAGARIQKYRGRKAASIKPDSEGRFAPRPLLLMSSLGSYSFGSGGESIDLVRWRRGKIRSKKSVRIEDYVYYNGMILTRSVIDRELTGGKGTFVLSNGASSYGLCLPLVRRRSYAGSYR